jgi:predicted transcriptional regulator
MLTKTLVKKQLEKLPEEFSLDELVGQLILVQKVEKGLMDSREGRFISEEELEKEIDKWFE